MSDNPDPANDLIGRVIRLPLPGPHPGGFVQYSTDGGQTWDPPRPPRPQPTEELFDDSEDTLHGQVPDGSILATGPSGRSEVREVARDVTEEVRRMLARDVPLGATVRHGEQELVVSSVQVSPDGVTLRARYEHALLPIEVPYDVKVEVLDVPKVRVIW